MITKDSAEGIAVSYLDELAQQVGELLRLTAMQDTAFGWVFFYQSEHYMQTKELRSMLAGNAPFLVDASTGAIHVLGTAEPAQVYIDEYARIHSKPGE